MCTGTKREDFCSDFEVPQGQLPQNLIEKEVSEGIDKELSRTGH